MTEYPLLNQQLAALIHGVPHRIANLSNAAALLYHTLPDLNWAGFYLMENGLLVLGLSMSRTPTIWPPAWMGTTISELDALSQAIWPGKR